ncbi:MAG TPA: lipid-binding SYLF domain-containing protein [Acidobacteriaceae bacterium]|jgi:lipid-binding SYLF domain-containing protein|nr:lipid-binding SYLF domain-containing protein [Acidobacteriaceae bacterium]
MKKTLAVCTVGLLAAGMTLAASAQNKIDNELDQATQIMNEMTGPQSTAGIPDAVLKDAKCVAVIPKMLKAGFVVGGQHGDGVATCKMADGRWSPPAPFQLSGASFGAQIGGEEQGYVMMIMNHQGMDALMSGHFKVGAGVDAAAGPVGREASGSGGWKASILSYSRAKGAYVGATLQGAELNQDHGATKALFGNEVPFADILHGQAHTTESAAEQFVHTINHAVRQAKATD